MQNFPTLSTARLVLSLPTISDLEDIIFHANSTSEIAENTITFPYPYEEKHAHFWLTMAEEGFAKKDDYIFAIREKENIKLSFQQTKNANLPHTFHNQTYPFSAYGCRYRRCYSSDEFYLRNF